MDTYGVEFYAQTNECKEKIINTNIDRYGVPVSSQNESVQSKMVNTNLERHGVPYTLMNKDIKTKANDRILDIYGVDNISTCPEIQMKKIETSRERYGCDYPMQNSDIFEKILKNAYSTKDYTFPSGKIVQIQGYEHFALDLLLKEYNENDISIGRSSMPEFWYYNEKKYKKYYPDIYLKNENLIIEVKSTWTYKIDRNEIIIKAKTVKYNGYNFMLLVFDKDGTIVFKTT